MLANPNTMAKRQATVVLMLLMCSLAFTSASSSTTEVDHDEANLLVHGEAGASWTTTLGVNATQHALFVVTCTTCEATVLSGQDTIASGTGGLYHLHQAETSEDLVLRIDFLNEESASVLACASTMASLQDRPAPGASADTTLLATSEAGDVWWVDDQPVRLDAGWSGGSTAVLNVSADLTAHVLAETADDAWVDLVLHHASNDVNLRLIVQNDTSEANLETHAVNPASLPSSHRLSLNDGERLLVMVEGTAPATSVALTMAAHPMSGAMHQATDGHTQLVGHGGQITALDVNETDAVHLTPAAETELLVHHLVQGTWVATSSAPVTAATTVWPLPGAEALRLTCQSPVCASTLHRTTGDDMGSASDAQGYLDLGDEVLLAGGSTGHLPLNGSASGHLVRATHDVADVLPFFIDAWEESIHLVKFSVWSSEPVMVEIIPIDPMTGTIDDEEQKMEVLAGQGESLSAQFGRGAHLIRISLVDADGVLNTTWGSDLVTLNYTVELAHGVVDEGDEPWFEPDEASQIWGERVRWILGFSFLIPVGYLAYIQQRRTRLANIMRVQRERLRSIVKRLDEGRPVEQERRDLHLALDAVATLDFEDACRSWGDPDLAHRTDELAFAAWRLDPRLAKHGTQAILIGLAAGPRTWEATALRFDAPLGASCEVKAVEPRFLHHGEDVFLDTVRADTVVFLTVELEGEATMVDLEVNGLVDAEPRAARATSSLILVSDEEA